MIKILGIYMDINVVVFIVFVIVSIFIFIFGSRKKK